MLNPTIQEQARALATEIAELRELGYADDDLDKATEVLAYRAIHRLHAPPPPLADAAEVPAERETIPTDEIAPPAGD